MNATTLKRYLQSRAHELGFEQVRVARARRLDEHEERLAQWLHKGYQGEMSYMANHYEKRLDPTQLVPGAKSVICLLCNYHNPDLAVNASPDTFKVAQYAYGDDYHQVIKDKLYVLLDDLRQKIGDIHGRCFVDSAPVMERQWAEIAGLGWNGKNTLLIHPRKGSYFFLAEIISDLDLEPDEPMRDYCGTCTKCIDACPTDAILPQGYQLDASKCISYATIELRDSIPAAFEGKMDHWIFGCDICQEVCPWNRFAVRHHEASFEPSPAFSALTRTDWIELTHETFDRLFTKSAIQRTSYEGLKRNIRFAQID